MDSILFLSQTERNLQNSIIVNSLIQYFESVYGHLNGSDEKMSVSLNEVFEKNSLISTSFKDQMNLLVEFILETKELDITLDEKGYFLSPFYYIQQS